MHCHALCLACKQRRLCARAGITPHMLTLVQNFYVPFMREVLLLHGVCKLRAQDLPETCCPSALLGTLTSRLAGNALFRSSP